MASFQALKAWQKTHQMVLAVYKLTRDLPKDERFEMGKQMRRAAYSAASNLAEGRERETDADFGHFLAMSAGSIAEVQYFLLLARDLEYLSDAQIQEAVNLAAEALRLVNGLRRTIREARGAR